MDTLELNFLYCHLYLGCNFNGKNFSLIIKHDDNFSVF